MEDFGAFTRELDKLASEGPLSNNPNWEQMTVDIEERGEARSWGLTSEAISELSGSRPVQNIMARLEWMYPDYTIGLMPECISGGACAPLVGNAIYHGQDFAWHVDMDPLRVSYGPWVERYGWYPNRRRGHPLFASVVIYLDREWPEEYQAETLFMDIDSGVGVCVRPSGGRAVLMDQDVPHRIVAPSAVATTEDGSPRPRYSLVLKLVLWPKLAAARPSLQGVRSSSNGPGDGQVLRLASRACK
mmetsp:Transcript_6560/g.24355  ORF Transcript_6560/g.24355 Transcript_6560/m.24355 type:complete len:245 (+) Transcript_6560:998-1732(+)